MFDNVLQQLQKPGTVGVIPTDTIYGIVCRAADRDAAARLYRVKRREGKPGTVIAADVNQLVELGLKARYLKPVEQYWPGAVSVIIPSGAELDYLHQRKGGLAVRIPDNAQLQALLRQTGPLLTSSANMPGEPPANTLEQSKAYFGDNIDFYIDGGDLSSQASSTVLRIVDDAVEVLRQGAVRIDEAGRVIK